MATNYQRGRAFEYRARNALTKRGAAYVMRAAQSKGKADLLALWPFRIPSEGGAELGCHECGASPPPWLVQCKYSIHGGGKLSKDEGAELVELAIQTGCVPVFARPGKNGRGVVFINLATGQEIT